MTSAYLVEIYVPAVSDFAPLPVYFETFAAASDHAAAKADERQTPVRVVQNDRVLCTLAPARKAGDM
jgi:hypothetical protein